MRRILPGILSILVCGEVCADDFGITLRLDTVQIIAAADSGYGEWGVLQNKQTYLDTPNVMSNQSTEDLDTRDWRDRFRVTIPLGERVEFVVQPVKIEFHLSF